MKKLITTIFVLIGLFSLAGGAAFAHEVVALPDPGLTPESSFYFLDKIGEALQKFFTFSSEGKAKLHITFAAERIAEIKVILETKGVEARGLEVAQNRLQTNLASAASILDSEKSRGKDISQLASELDDELEGPKFALEEAFRDKKKAIENQMDELKEKIKAARQASDAAQVEALAKQLAEAKAQKELLEKEEDEQEKALEEEHERIEKEMEAKAEAEKKIRKAERGKQKLMDEAGEENLTIPDEAFAAFEEHIKEAKEALAAGNFKEAKHHAEEAKESLEAVEDAIDDLEDAREEGEELKEEEKERNENDAERLEKEQKKAEEKIRKAEERLREAGKIDEEDEEDEHRDNKQGASESRAFQTITVVIRSGRFDDNEVDIKPGDTIRWINQDAQPHWPASNPHPVHMGLPGFDALRSLGQDESYKFTFTQRGTFNYHDHLSPSITGRVIVK